MIPLVLEPSKFQSKFKPLKGLHHIWSTLEGFPKFEPKTEWQESLLEVPLISVLKAMTPILMEFPHIGADPERVPKTSRPDISCKYALKDICYWEPEAKHMAPVQHGNSMDKTLRSLIQEIATKHL